MQSIPVSDGGRHERPHDRQRPVAGADLGRLRQPPDLLPEGFLCADAVLRLAQNVTSGLHVNEKIVEKTVRDYLPFIATENLMMEGVKRGGDRQQLHEIIRVCSMDATAKMKNGESWDLLASLSEHPEFHMTREEMEATLSPEKFIGRCPEQVEAYLKEAAPLLAGISGADAEITL